MSEHAVFTDSRLDRAARPSRRGVIGALASLAATPLALAPFQASAAKAEIAAVSDPRDRELIAIGKNIENLERERDEARAECLAARARFEAAAPVQPPDLRVIVDEDPWRLEFYPHGELGYEGSPVDDRNPGAVHRLVIDAERLKAQFSAHSERTAHGKWVRRTLKIAQKYQADLEAAAKESGYRAMSKRLILLDAQINDAAMEAFKIEAATHAGLAAQARAMLAVANEGVSGYWAKVVWSPIIARALLRLSPAA
jgi:hypothetical protein